MNIGRSSFGWFKTSTGITVVAASALLFSVVSTAVGQRGNDSLYYVYVNGITCPLCLTNITKQLRQVAGVANVKTHDYKRGVFAVTPQRGARLSESVLLAAVRRSGFQPDRVVPPGSAPAARALPPDRGDAAPELADARSAFRAGDYEKTLNLVREVTDRPRPGLASDRPRAGLGSDRPQPGLGSDRPRPGLGSATSSGNKEVQQFLSLVYFALGDYQAASAAARRALNSGAYWDWKRLSGHYAKTSDYTAHLTNLEDSIREMSAPDKRFLVGYHYLMLGYKEAAGDQLQLGAEVDEELTAKLLDELRRDGQPEAQSESSD